MVEKPLYSVGNNVRIAKDTCADYGKLLGKEATIHCVGMYMKNVRSYIVHVPSTIVGPIYIRAFEPDLVLVNEG